MYAVRITESTHKILKTIHPLTIYLTETSINTLANRVDPDQPALRAA